MLEVVPEEWGDASEVDSIEFEDQDQLATSAGSLMPWLIPLILIGGFFLLVLFIWSAL